MARILIVGFGNPLGSDDGLGWHIAKQLSAELSRTDIQVIARHQLTPEIADLASRAEKVLFVDAAHGGDPGSLRWKRVAPAASSNRYSHELSPATILRLAEELYGRCPPAYLITVAGETFATGDTMSVAVSAAMPILLSRIRQFIEGGVGAENK